MLQATSTKSLHRIVPDSTSAITIVAYENSLILDMNFNTESSNAFISWFIITLLKTAGISVNSQNSSSFLYFLKYYLLYAFASTTGCQIVLLKECKTTYQVTLTLAYIFSGIFLNTSTVVLHLYKKNLFNILNFVNDELPFIMSRNRDTRKSNEEFRKLFFSYGIAYYVVYTFACISPFVFFPISGNKLGDTNTLLIPSWFPWQIDSGLKYILTIGLQFSWLFPLSIPVLLNFTFYLYFIIEVRIQYEILCGNISKLKEYPSSCQNEENRAIRIHFTTCVQHHQIIVKLITNFCCCYKWVFIVDLVYSLANLSLLLFGLVSGERTISAVMQQFSAFVVVFTFLFLYCFIGEMLQNLNEELTLCLYDIEWFEQNIQFRKNVLVFASLIHRGVNFKAGKDGVASYELFFSVVKLAYSYFNILITTFSH